MNDDWDENRVVAEAPKPMVFTNSSHGHKEQQPRNDSDWGSDSASSASYNRDFGGGSRGDNRSGGFRGGNRDRNDSRGGNRDWGDRGGNREWGDRGGNRDSGDRGGNRDWGDRKSSQGPRRSDDDGNATIIKVPSRFVGRIIGRGGSKINDLQFESGARINVTKETEGDETMVRLSGDDNAVAKAESLIRELTVDRDNYRGNTGDRDNYRGNAGGRDNF